MTETLKYAEVRNAYKESGYREKNQCFAMELSPPVDCCKNLRFQIARLSAADTLQQNWPRIIHRELEEVTSQSLVASGNFRMSDLSKSDDEELLALDPDQVADFIACGGKDAVDSIFRALQYKPAHRETFRVIAKIATELINSSDPDSDALQHTSFIQRAQRLDEYGQTDAALDLIYDSIDEILRDGKFSNLDTIFEQVQTDNLSADMLLGLLTATLPARSRLSCRKTFFSEVEMVLRDRGEFKDGLLTGLE